MRIHKSYVDEMGAPHRDEWRLLYFVAGQVDFSFLAASRLRVRGGYKMDHSGPSGQFRIPSVARAYAVSRIFSDPFTTTLIVRVDPFFPKEGSEYFLQMKNYTSEY